jgi:uncharacterized damage-inducible protein DinB
MTESNMPEPWLRGTLTDVPAVIRGVIHALELTHEDILRWCEGLIDEEINARPSGIAPVAFHLRHIPRSIDRLLTYAEGGQLSAAQLTAMKTELAPNAKHDALFAEFNNGIEQAVARIRAMDPNNIEENRKVGRKQLPTTVGGLLVHVADHTQRHVGQAITTAKIVTAARHESRSA